MTKKSKRFQLTLAGKDAVAGILFITPFLLGFLLFMARPLIQSVIWAFSNVDMDVPNSRFVTEWVGLENFDRAFNIDPSFVRFMTEEIGRMVPMVLSILIFSFFISVLINQKFKGRALVRAIFFLPVILASGVLVGLESNNSLLNLMSTEIQDANAMRANITGTLERILITATGAGGVNEFMDFIFALVNQIYVIAMASGIQILIFLAGLQTIPTSVYEASSIEGATAWENFWKITFPMLSPMILVVLVYSVIDFLMRTDSEVMNHIHHAMFRSLMYGFGSAMTWTFFAAAAAILGIASLLVSRMVYYYD